MTIQANTAYAKFIIAVLAGNLYFMRAKDKLFNNLNLDHITSNLYAEIIMAVLMAAPVILLFHMLWSLNLEETEIVEMYGLGSKVNIEYEQIAKAVWQNRKNSYPIWLRCASAAFWLFTKTNMMNQQIVSLYDKEGKLILKINGISNEKTIETMLGKISEKAPSAVIEKKG